MALPTTNLTFHMDASNNDDVIKTGSTSAVDGENVEEWEDDDGKDMSFWYPVSAAQGPTYKTVTPLMQLACLDFNGTSEVMGLFASDGGTTRVLSDIFTSTAKTLILSLYIKSASLNNSNAWLNHGIFSDVGALFGLHLRTTGGVYTLQAYNWDGNEDKAEATVSINTSYVVTLRHDGTNIYLGLNGAAEASVASGATAIMSGRPNIGVNGDGLGGLSTAFADIRVGQIAGWNVALTGTDLTDANSYFTDKWLAAAMTGTTVNPSYRLFPKPKIQADWVTRVQL